MAEDRSFRLQQFTTINRKPWFALQEQSDAGVVRQWTGYRHELEDLVQGFAVEELLPITEEEFFCRFEN